MQWCVIYHDKTLHVISSIVNILLCDHVVADEDKMLHIVGQHYYIDDRLYTPLETRKHFAAWRTTHVNWLRFVATPYVKGSHLSVEDYLNNLCNADQNGMNLGL